MCLQLRCITTATCDVVATSACNAIAADLELQVTGQRQVRVLDILVGCTMIVWCMLYMVCLYLLPQWPQPSCGAALHRCMVLAAHQCQLAGFITPAVYRRLCLAVYLLPQLRLPWRLTSAAAYFSGVCYDAQRYSGAAQLVTLRARAINTRLQVVK